MTCLPPAGVFVEHPSAPYGQNAAHMSGGVQSSPSSCPEQTPQKQTRDVRPHYQRYGPAAGLRRYSGCGCLLQRRGKRPVAKGLEMVRTADGEQLVMRHLTACVTFSRISGGERPPNFSHGNDWMCSAVAFAGAIAIAIAGAVAGAGAGAGAGVGGRVRDRSRAVAGGIPAKCNPCAQREMTRAEVSLCSQVTGLRLKGVRHSPFYSSDYQLRSKKCTFVTPTAAATVL